MSGEVGAGCAEGAWPVSSTAIGEAGVAKIYFMRRVSSKVPFDKRISLQIINYGQLACCLPSQIKFY